MRDTNIVRAFLLLEVSGTQASWGLGSDLLSCHLPFRSFHVFLSHTLLTHHPRGSTMKVSAYFFPPIFQLQFISLRGVFSLGELCVSLSTFKAGGVVRVEFSEVVCPVLGVSHPVFPLWVTLHSQVMALALPSVVYFSYSLLARLRYWKDSKSKRVIADNWIQPCLSMKTAFLGFLPTMLGCQEKMLLALQMIWPNSGLVLGLFWFVFCCFVSLVMEKNEYFWLLNYLAYFCSWHTKLCFYTLYMNLWFYVYSSVWRKMQKASG